MDQKIKDCVFKIEAITVDLEIGLRDQLIDFYPAFVSGLIKSDVCLPGLKQGKIDMPFIETQIFGPKAQSAPSGQTLGLVPPPDEAASTVKCPHCGEKFVLMLKPE